MELAGCVFGHLERRCVLVAGPGDFSLALAGAFLSAGVERFQLLGNEEHAPPPARSTRPWPTLSCFRHCSSMPTSSWRKRREGVALDRRLMKGVVRLRRGRPMLLVDASADGSLVDRIASLDDVFLYTAADLAAITRDAPWARLGAPTTPRERLFTDAGRAFALELGE